MSNTTKKLAPLLTTAEELATYLRKQGVTVTLVDFPEVELDARTLQVVEESTARALLTGKHLSVKLECAWHRTEEAHRQWCASVAKVAKGKRLLLGRVRVNPETNEYVVHYLRQNPDLLQPYQREERLALSDPQVADFLSTHCEETKITELRWLATLGDYDLPEVLKELDRETDLAELFDLELPVGYQEEYSELASYLLDHQRGGFVAKIDIPLPRQVKFNAEGVVTSSTYSQAVTREAYIYGSSLAELLDELSSKTTLVWQEALAAEWERQQRQPADVS